MSWALMTFVPNLAISGVTTADLASRFTAGRRLGVLQAAVPRERSCIWVGLTARRGRLETARRRDNRSKETNRGLAGVLGNKGVSAESVVPEAGQ